MGGRQREGRVSSVPSVPLCFKMAVNRLIHDGRGVPTSCLGGAIYCEEEEEEGKIGDWAVLPMTVVQRRTRHERINPWRT